MSKLIKFESGLRLVVERLRNTRSLSIGVFVGVGSLYETKDNNGISHFIEHMFFKGTKKRTAFDIVSQLEDIGVNINAYTSKNITAYHTSGLSDFAENCTEILSDIYFNSNFDEESLQKEKAVVLEEIKMSHDDNEDRCLENLVSAHYGPSRSIAYPILGTAENIMSFDKSAIDDFMSKYYIPENTVISMAGDITIEKATELVKKYFEKNIEKASYQKRKFQRIKPKSRYAQVVKNDCQQAHVALSFPAHGLKSKKHILNGIFCGMLAGGMSSRLFQRIRDELGLVYTIYAAPIAYVDDGYFYIYFATDPSQVPLAISEIKKILDDIKQNGFTDEELERVAVQTRTAYILSKEQSMSVMRANARSMVLLNRRYNVNKQLKELEQINQDKVKEFIDFALDYDKVSISYVGKKPDFNAYNLFMNKEH
ncbi:MAG: insulinase family protein [Clostridiales bacterium]|nr:insulinase family protein [Clostridiales bacterium]